MSETDVQTMGDMPYTRTREIFDKMDSNKDGVLSKDEFVRGCMDDETLYKLLACSSNDEST